MQRWSCPGRKIAFVLQNQTGQFQTFWETPPLQQLQASLSPPRAVQRRTHPRARTSRSQPIRCGASPPGGEDGGDGGGDGDDGGADDDPERIYYLPVDEVRLHPVSQEIYRDEPTPEMVESVRKRGILEPLQVVRRGDGYRLLSGHNRLSAAKAAGIFHVPIRVVSVRKDGEVGYLIEANRYRAKKPSQQLREALALEPQIREQALARQRSGRGADGSGGRGRKKTLGKSDPEVSGVRTRDLLARKVGLASGTQLKQLTEIAERSPDLLAQIDASKKKIGRAYAELRREDRLREHAALAANICPRSDVILGDCREVLPTLADGRFAAIITDPPYCLSEGGVIHERAGALPLNSDFGEWDHLSEEESQTLIDSCAPEFFRVLRPGGALYLMPGDALYPHWATALRRAGFTFPKPHLLGWLKRNPPPSVRKLGWRCALEPILYVRKPGKDVFNYLGDAEMRSVLSFPLVGANRLHPTQKPVELIERLIFVSTSPGDEVLDPFGGSGTTGEAALRCRRHALLIERNETFHAVATKRLERASQEIQGKPEKEGPS